MAKQVDKNKFSWVIKNFSSLKSDIIYSDEFIVGRCKWRLKAFPKGNKNNTDDLSLYLVVANAEFLPFGWRRHAEFSLEVVNQYSAELSEVKETEHWFDEKGSDWGFTKMIRLDKLKAKDDGFMVNNEVKIVAGVNVFEVIGELDVPDESEEATQPLKNIKLNVDGPADWVVDVDGFKVLSSQAESVKRIFERHPDMTLEFRAKNQHLKTACMNVLLNLIDTLCQPLQELSYDDLVGADSALPYVKDSGFKVDWLEKKLEEVKEKKKEEQIGVIQMQKSEEKLKDFKQKCSDKEALLEKEKEELKDLKQKCSDKEALLEKEKEELKDLKQKCSDMEALLEKEKAKVLAAIAAPLTLDDVV